MMRVEKASVDSMVEILHNFKLGCDLEINYHKSVAYQCGRRIQLGWWRNINGGGL